MPLIIMDAIKDDFTPTQNEEIISGKSSKATGRSAVDCSAQQTSSP